MLIEQVDILNFTIYYYVTKLVTYCVIFFSFSAVPQ
ncbi:Hypothetical protein PAU_02594 [Photorhabdus asymbiotica]|uniref:Uncharacterized protein n=1 Tax=Photorhabdus asymbiotica subsp. asymbiotica (strain ATCC 43949 / 3105-77) TaxID=553480 RepID=C7BNR7_PHOAA|nr:Hypothetical protein PAU_02594 [Photorhabdus asymbiotica]